MLKHVIGSALFAALAVAPLDAARAQAEVERVGAHSNWSVFRTGTGASRVCWIRSEPTKQDARRSGQRVSVSRGEVFLSVAARPADGVTNEISTQVGYTLRNDSDVRMDVGSSRFSLFTDGDKAWPASSAVDNQIVAAMKRGSDAVLTGTSSRGTTTIDTYSLIGFTAALEQAQGLCK